VRPLRVLLAEDESIIRLGLRRILEEAGHQVVAAPDGRTAVKLARQTRPDLALLDIKMPGLDGLEAAREIYLQRPLPIVLLTAYGDQELVERAAGLPILSLIHISEPTRRYAISYAPGAAHDAPGGRGDSGRGGG